MSGFNGFSEAARLYSENVDLIEEVKRAYDESATAFLDGLEREIQRQVAPVRFNSEKAARSRSWWLGTAEREQSAYLWLVNGPDKLDHDGIVCGAYADQASERQIEAVRRLAEHAELDLIVKNGKTLLFDLVIDFEEPNPQRLIEATAQHFARVLREMTDAFEKAAPKKGKK